MQEGTQGWYDATDGGSADAGPIEIRNILVVASADGEATLIASFINDGGPDSLVEVTIGEGVATPESGPLELTPDAATNVGPTSDTRVDLAGTGAVPGLTVDVEFKFESAPRVSVNTIVAEDVGIYADAFSGIE
jgi:hypothetical protein